MRDPRSIELPPTIERKDYQIDSLCGVVAKWESGCHSVLLCLPTGTGKTITSGLISKYMIEEHQRKVLFIAHRTELIEQAVNTYVNAFGFSTAIEMGEQSERQFVKDKGVEPEVVVASVQSLYEERLMNRFAPDRFGLIIIDEAHHATAASYRAILEYFNEYYLLGLTATPDGATRDIRRIFGSIGYQMRLRVAIEDGHLVPIKIRRIEVPVDLRSIRTTGGDYNLGDLAERLSPSIEVLAYQIHANIGDRQTVVFTPDVGSAHMVADMLKAMGRQAEYVAGTAGKFGITKDVRRERLARYKAMATQVIVCCDLLVEGWDVRHTSCVVIARATRKRYKACQMIGRGTRLCPEIGKTDCLVLDLDWQQDDEARSLELPAMLFSEGSNVDALEILSDRISGRRVRGGDDRNQDIDILRELREIELDLHQARVIKVKYTGKHTEIYAHTDNSPFGVGKVLDIKVRKTKDFDPYHCGPATPFQIDKLKRLGVEGVEKMNLWGASRLISKLESREKKGLASHQQVKNLLAAGVNEEQARAASKKEAASIIAQSVLKQGEFF